MAWVIEGEFAACLRRLALLNDETLNIEQMREPVVALLDWVEVHLLDPVRLRADLLSKAQWTQTPSSMILKEVQEWLETGIVPAPDEVYLKGR
jgi:hypothetical protein